MQQRVHLLHRLDRPTSGVLLFALSKEAAAKLAIQFRERQVYKQYLAVVRGAPPEVGTIDIPLQQKPKAPQEALTHYKRLASIYLDVDFRNRQGISYSLIEAVPKTGRMHQIRRHFKHISHPIICDNRHGDRFHNRYFKAHYACYNLLLLAEMLCFVHPYTQRMIEIKAELPPYFTKIISAFNWQNVLSNRKLSRK